MNDREANNVTIKITERRYKPGEAYSCRMLVYPLAEGAYSAYCLRLPEIASQAATEDEAVEKVVEQFRQAVLGYRAAGERLPMVPWDKVEVPNLPGARVLHQTVLMS
jgi:predicted RNase H-like HicB family nuclease